MIPIDGVTLGVIILGSIVVIPVLLGVTGLILWAVAREGGGRRRQR